MKVLLCPPQHYGLDYEINPWMHLTNRPDPSLAAAQWEGLAQALRAAGAALHLINPLPGQPDMVFTANGGLCKGNRVLLPNFRFPQRQGERAGFAAWFREQGWQVLALPNGYAFEGEGDALWVGETLFAGYRFRTDLGAHRRMGELLDCEVVSLALQDPRFYHLDTCFLPLGQGRALYYPPAFDGYAQQLLQDRLPGLQALSEADALNFCANGVLLGNRLLTSPASPAMAAQLQAWGLELVPLPLGEFHKAGGGAKCLTLLLDPCG